MEGNDDDNGPKRRETRRLGLGEFFFISVVFFIYLMTYIGTTDALKVRRGSVGATTTITGPNDTRHCLGPR